MNAIANEFIREVLFKSRRSLLRRLSRSLGQPVYSILAISMPFYLAVLLNFEEVAIYVVINFQKVLNWTLLLWILSAIYIPFYWPWKDVFREDFKSGLRPNIWEYTGGWKIEHDEKGRPVLDVTDSQRGGFVRAFVTWQDYELEFEARIINEWIGWIVRASSLNTYVHQKLGEKKIHTHFVMSGVFAGSEKLEQEHGLELVEKTWYPIRIAATGQWLTVHIEVENKEYRIFQDKVFGDMPPRALKMPRIDEMGKSGLVILEPSYASGSFGFRLFGDENAQYRKLRAYRKK